MSTNYRVTTPREFFSLSSQKSNETSLLDQLSGVLKNSLHTIWGYMKTIDVKGSFGNASVGDNGVIENNKD